LPCGGRGLPVGAEGWLPHLGELLPRQEPTSQEAMLQVLDAAGLERCLALHSAYIPVPRHRKLSGKAGIDEVMAATVLTSLSTSPLVLGHPPATPAPGKCVPLSLPSLDICPTAGPDLTSSSPEPGSEVWKEVPTMSSSCSSSSNTSGDWSWDPPSDRSTPSTPSPPLSSHVPSSFLPAPLLDEGPDEANGTHFVFGEPVPRKRKNSTKVMFKCLWKSCGKVLSSSSGMQKHIRTMHLGRKADLEQSDGEEDFYYTELDVDVDSLTDGLSSLTPVSPTSSVPPAFPGPEAQGLVPLPSPDPALASPLAPSGLCHVHTDHAYQVRGTRWGYGHTDGITATLHPTQPLGASNREMWCTACRWKKACQRFLD
ncbi:ZN704 protein, partial [Nycticryphes semicollaris]|nr:ZN704 protein [Nycticryphes semicollaris]